LNIIPLARAPETQLTRYDEMCRAIAAAYEVDEVKDIRDKAKAIEVYSQQAMNVDAERQACEIRLRAERRCGQLLKERQKQHGARGTGSNQYRVVETDDPTPPTLTELHISKEQSSNWQKLADIPEEEFEQALKTEEKPTTSGLIAAFAAKELKRDVVDAGALWLWGRLQDFERDGLLARDQAPPRDAAHDCGRARSRLGMRRKLGVAVRSRRPQARYRAAIHPRLEHWSV
jgi:hypothetical protein